MPLTAGVAGEEAVWVAVGMVDGFWLSMVD